ncbi:hypothetical protein EQG64_00335 [Streptomyces sp. S6]|nr:hypothetical protein EQG64_00335 [Streptomyces sp. S6]
MKVGCPAGRGVRAPGGSVTATAAHGTLLVSEVARGDVRSETSCGAVEVGVRKGTAAWLDRAER